MVINYRSDGEAARSAVAEIEAAGAEAIAVAGRHVIVLERGDSDRRGP